MRVKLLFAAALVILSGSILAACTMFRAPEQKYRVEVHCQCPPGTDNTIPLPTPAEILAV